MGIFATDAGVKAGALEGRATFSIGSASLGGGAGSTGGIFERTGVVPTSRRAGFWARGDGLASQLLFFIALGIWIVATILLKRSTYLGILDPYLDYTVIRYSCLGILAVREVFLGRWDRWSLLGLAVLGFMAAMAFISKYTFLFDTICFVFASRRVPFRRIVAFGFVMSALLLLLVIVSSQVGILPDTVIQRAGAIDRHHLGFSHPNTGPGMMFFAVCAWVFLRGKRYGVLDAVVIVVLVAWIFSYTNSRTACSMMLFVALLALVINHVSDKAFVTGFSGVLLRTLLVGSVVICCVVSIALTVNYDPSIEWMQSLNNVLSNRLVYGHGSLERYGIPLLGQNVDVGSLGSTRYDKITGTWVATDKPTTIVDCAYMKLLLRCGLPFLVLAVALFTWAAARAYRRREWLLLLVVAAIAIFDVSETYAPYMEFNMFVFVVGGLFCAANLHEKVVMPAEIVVDSTEGTAVLPPLAAREGRGVDSERAAVLDAKWEAMPDSDVPRGKHAATPVSRTSRETLRGGEATAAVKAKHGKHARL